MTIDELKKLAGIDSSTASQPQSLENISHTATELRKKERKMGIRPGDPDWFKLWFSRPYLTGPVRFRGRKK